MMGKWGSSIGFYCSRHAYSYYYHLYFKLIGVRSYFSVLESTCTFTIVCGIISTFTIQYQPIHPQSVPPPPHHADARPHTTCTTAQVHNSDKSPKGAKVYPASRRRSNKRVGLKGQLAPQCAMIKKILSWHTKGCPPV